MSIFQKFSTQIRWIMFYVFVLKVKKTFQIFKFSILYADVFKFGQKKNNAGGSMDNIRAPFTPGVSEAKSQPNDNLRPIVIDGPMTISVPSSLTG